GGSVIGNSSYGLGTNGSWNSGRNGYTGLNAPTGTMTYAFQSGPVSGVGGFLNYAPGTGGDVIILALDASNNVLESYDISILAPIITPDGTNAGAFRGILRVSPDIAAFQITNSFVVLDNLEFTSTTTAAPVPEPTSLLLLGAGLVTLRR